MLESLEGNLFHEPDHVSVKVLAGLPLTAATLGQSQGLPDLQGSRGMPSLQASLCLMARCCQHLLKEVVSIN